MAGLSGEYVDSDFASYSWLVSNSDFSESLFEDEEEDEEEYDDNYDNVVDHDGFYADWDDIPRGIKATDLTSDDYEYSYDLGKNFVESLPDSVTITFEPDNGWVDVDGFASSFTADDHQFLAGSSSVYLTSPASLSLDQTKGIATSFVGTHADGSASGTVEYTEGEGSYEGSRVQFELFNIGHSGGPDEPDLARLNSALILIEDLIQQRVGTTSLD